MTNKRIELYTDGSCLGNPGPGGWAAILRLNNHELTLTGGCAHTTNNRMELTAVIEGLKALKYPCTVELYTDSKYVADGISKGWAVSWRSNNWMKKGGQAVLNPDLWEELLKLFETHKVEVYWIKGHAGYSKNELCDKIAVAEAKKYLNK